MAREIIRLTSEDPGMNYTHLTQDERYQIAILLKAGHDQSDIARVMNRHKSSTSRELRRNRGQRGYRPKQALGHLDSRVVTPAGLPQRLALGGR